MTELLPFGTVLCQGGIVLVLLEALRRRDVAAAVNGLVAFAVALVPAMVEFFGTSALGWNVTLGPELPLWLAVAGLLHSIGMLGPYDSVWWWDSLTHTVSAALVTALAYAGLLVVTADAELTGSLPGIAPVLAVLLTMVAGTFWELLELVARDLGEWFDIEPVLVHYGWRDTALDLGFDLVGALVVVLVDLRVFVPLAEASPRQVEALLLGFTGTMVGGSLLIGLLLLLSARFRS